MSKALALTERERGWLAHLARAHESGETLKAYAERHGLSRYSLYDAKSRLTRAGLWREITGKPKRQRAAFVPVRVTPPASPGWRLTHPSGWVLEGHSLPDPAWLHVVMAREESDVTA